jgi:predicted CoA-binding protein
MSTLTFVRENAQKFLTIKELAVAGTSRDPKKFGNIVFETLKSKGFKVVPVNPNAETINNEPCIKTIAEIPDHVKNLLIVVKSSETELIVNQAIEKGISAIWIQQGSETKSAVQKAQNAGIMVISGKCILMYANPTGFHKFHMRINKFFGKY